MGLVWEQDYCAGGCGYWDDFRLLQNLHCAALQMDILDMELFLTSTGLMFSSGMMMRAAGGHQRPSCMSARLQMIRSEAEDETCFVLNIS